MTKREFQRQKRMQFKNLCRYIEITNIVNDCAYLPKEQYAKLIKGLDLIYEARDELRSWWKWA